MSTNDCGVHLIRGWSGPGHPDEKPLCGSDGLRRTAVYEVLGRIRRDAQGSDYIECSDGSLMYLCARCVDLLRASDSACRRPILDGAL